jgi:hypothetical protein
MSNEIDERPDGMQIFRVADRRWAAFTEAGDFLAVLDYDQAQPLIFRPEARRQFLAEHSNQAGAEMSR